MLMGFIEKNIKNGARVVRKLRKTLEKFMFLFKCTKTIYKKTLTTVVQIKYANGIYRKHINNGSPNKKC